MEERSYFNKSNIDFSKFSEPQNNPQKDRIYTYESSMREHIREKASEVTQVETKFYRNKIFHSAHKYKVPIFEYSKKSQNTSYQDFYSTHRKFVKPYGELTKYVDTLSKNKTIIRRANFDIPITLDIQSNFANSKAETIKYRKTFTRYEKHEKVRFSPPKKEEKLDKTIPSQYAVFRKLLDRERNHTSDRVDLNNSMNRLLAAEMIGLHIHGATTKGRTKTIEV